MLGTVCYIPGQSAPHAELEDKQEGYCYWAILTDDGTVLSWLFAPQDIQPSKNIQLMGRDHPFKPLKSDDVLK
jgi:hypothetical protein